jgi:O-antigen ligase
MIAAMLIGWAGWKDRRIRRLTLTAIVLVAAAASAAAASIDFSELWRVGTLGRVTIWRGALAMIRDHWFLGVGLGQFAEQFTQYRMTDYYTRYPHSVFLEVAAETGIVGVTALTGFVITSVRGSLRAVIPGGESGALSFESYLLAGAMLLLVHATVDIDWHAPANVILLFTLLATSGAEDRRSSCSSL